MLKLAQSVMLVQGWRRAGIALAAGVSGALALPPLGFFPAFLVPMVISVWLLDGAAGRASSGFAGGSVRLFASRLWAAAVPGWWLGLGYFAAGLWWIGAAFLVDEQFVWAMPIGVVALPVLLACFTGVGFALARLLWAPRWPRILALAIGLGASEWLRGHVMTGFPWNDFGMVLGSNLWLAQFASLTGLYGLTVLAVLLFAAPACLVDGGRRPWLALAAPALALGGLALFGSWRLADSPAQYVAGVKLRLLQPNTRHDLKFRAMAKEDLIAQYLALSDQATSPERTGLADVTHLVWPESAFPFILSRDPPSLARIGAALPQGTVLLTGAARVGNLRDSTGQLPYYNSIHVIASGGAILSTYDKMHLVPFGEYVPFASILRNLGIQQFVLASFTAGQFRQMLTVPGLPSVAPLICYEAIFSGDVLTDGQDAPAARPGLFLNVTDDSWFGLTPGPHQHLAHARLRSIEEGIPMVRAADTGISAIIDPVGRILKSLPLGSEGVLDGQLPKVNPSTLFSRNRLLASLTVWLISLFAYSIARLRI